MNTKDLNVTISALLIALLAGVMITGCAIIDEQIAMGSDPSAEEATQRITNDQSLERISLNSQNEKARILAVKKLKNEERLLEFLSSADTAPAVRITAFNRLVELGIAEKLIGKDGNKQGQDRYRDRFLDVLVKGIGSDITFPEEWRIKAVKAYDRFDDVLKEVVMDDRAPVRVRIAAIKKTRLKEREYIKILTAAVDKNNPSRADYESLARAYLSKEATTDNDMRNGMSAMDKGIDNIICNYHDLDVSLNARKLAFSCLRREEDICAVLMDIARIERDTDSSNMKADDTDLAKYVLEKTDQKLIEKFFLYIQKYNVDEGTMLPFLLEASKRITDETMLMKIADNDRLRDNAPKVARECVKRIKSPQFKKSCDAVLAQCGENAKECAEALVRLYPVAPARAYEIAKRYLDDKENQRIMAIEDITTLVGLVKLAKKDKSGSDNWIDKRERKFKDGLLNCVKRQVKAMTDESLGKLVETSKAKALELSRSGNVCVIGNYYLKMPALCFIALGNTQDVKATPLDWEWEEENKQVIMTEIAFDSKNLYKATGLEKTEAKFGLPSKLGIARFEVGMTKVRYNRNYFAEAMGSYDFNTVSGGDIYYRSETQAKNVVLLLWEKSGQLVMSQPE